MTLAQSLESSLKSLPPNGWEALRQRDFAALEGWLQPLLAAEGAAAEASLAVAAGGLERALDEDWPQALEAWRQTFPGSVLPGVVACLAWDARAMAARGAGWSEDVQPGQWQQAGSAQAALFVHALAVAERGPLPWLLAQVLMRSVLVLGEPEWLGGWLFQGRHPSPADPAWPELRQALAETWEGAAPLPALPVRLPAGLAAAAAGHVRQDEEPEALFWLRLSLGQGAHGLQALLVYASLRTPRWGGSREEILWLADSPLAARLDAAERNQIRLQAWLDELDVHSVDLDDPQEVQAAFAHGLATLSQPLSARGRARLYLQLAELAYAMDNPAMAAAYYAQAADPQAALTVDDVQLTHMLGTAAATGMGDWLAAFAARGRLGSAWAAVLYGLLCDTGWCGMQQDRQVAEQWYRHGSSLAPLPLPEHECPFNDVFHAFDEDQQRSALQHLMHCGAELGHPEMQFALGYFHSEYEQSYDIAQALHWYRLAAAQDFPRALYNLSLLYDGGIEQGGLLDMTPVQLAGLSNDCELRCLELAADQPEWNERSVRRIDSCLAGVDHYLKAHPADAARGARIVAMLEHYAGMGWSDAMRCLAWHHQAEDRWQARDFDKAVFWCEAALRLEPDEPANLELKQALQHGVMGSMRYARAAARIAPEALPGAAE